MIMIVMVIMTVILMMMTRSQPGESPASYVVQGLMDFLVSKHKIAQELREKLIFKVEQHQYSEDPVLNSLIYF